jgi:hypothetical protein
MKAQKEKKIEEKKKNDKRVMHWKSVGGGRAEESRTLTIPSHSSDQIKPTNFCTTLEKEFISREERDCIINF